MNGSKNFWFMGTGQFAELCLEGLINRDITFSKIITGLPTRSGRNNKENPSHVEIKASELGLSVTRTGKLTENHELIRELETNPPEIIFVIDFGQIIKPPFLDLMCLNIHPSLLPEYRGAAPIQRALLDGRDKTGVTVFRLAKSMDSGDILAQSEINIAGEYNASDLYNILSDLGCEIAAESLNSPLSFTPQDDSLATFADKLSKEDFALSFHTMSAEKIFNSVRALDMSGGAYVMINNKRVKLWRVKLRKDFHDEPESGKILELANNPVISCQDYAVELIEVQNEGKKRTSGLEWSRGIRLKLGGIL